MAPAMLLAVLLDIRQDLTEYVPLVIEVILMVVNPRPDRQTKAHAQILSHAPQASRSGEKLFEDSMARKLAVLYQ
jgi:hypothetical protein